MVINNKKMMMIIRVENQRFRKRERERFSREFRKMEMSLLIMRLRRKGLCCARGIVIWTQPCLLGSVQLVDAQMGYNLHKLAFSLLSQ